MLASYPETACRLMPLPVPRIDRFMLVVDLFSSRNGLICARSPEPEHVLFFVFFLFF